MNTLHNQTSFGYLYYPRLIINLGSILHTLIAKVYYGNPCLYNHIYHQLIMMPSHTSSLFEAFGNFHTLYQGQKPLLHRRVRDNPYPSQKRILPILNFPIRSIYMFLFGCGKIPITFYAPAIKGQIIQSGVEGKFLITVKPITCQNIGSLGTL